MQRIQAIVGISGRWRCIALAAVLCVGCGAAAPSPVDSSWVSRERAGITVQAQGADVGRLDEWLTVAETGRARIQTFFDRALAGSFTLTVYPTRDAIDAYWRTAFRVRDDQLFIDARFGRARNADLLRDASTAEVLADLDLTESQFLEQWREWCCR